MQIGQIKNTLLGEMDDENKLHLSYQLSISVSVMIDDGYCKNNKKGREYKGPSFISIFLQTVCKG